MTKYRFATLIAAFFLLLPNWAQASEAEKWIELLLFEQARLETSIKESKHEQVRNLRNQIEMEHRFRLAQMLIGGGHLLQKQQVQDKLNKIYEQLDPRLQRPDLQKPAKHARRQLSKIIQFVEALNPLTHQMLVSQYAEKQGGVIRAVKHGIMELPAETLRFVSAIVIMRIYNCFGTHGGELLKWTASAQDPVCVHEIVEMLKSPIFYAGFSGFIIASRATQASLMNLAKLNHLRSSKELFRPSTTTSMIISNTALAAGFFTDHMIQTILGNEDLRKCASSKKFTKSVIAIDPKDKKALQGDFVGLTKEGHKIYRFKERIKNPHCKKFWNHVGSSEFMLEHTAVPAFSLVTTAVAMSAGSAALGKTVGKVYQKSKTLKKVGGGLTLAISAVPGGGAVAGFVIGVGRLLVFFGLNEMIEPIIKQKYYDTVLKVLNNSNHAEFRGALSRLNPQDMKRIKKTCTSHYSGQQNDSLEVCSTIPLIADMATFRDYSLTWRQKKILGKFYEAYGRWRTKMDNSILHYSNTLYQMKVMSISREMKYSSNGQVDYYDRFFTQIENSLHAYVKKIREKTPHPDDPLGEIQALYNQYAQLDSSAPEEKKQKVKILESLKGYRWKLFQVIQYKDYLNQELKELRDGDMYYGFADSEAEVNEIKEKALELLSGNVHIHTVNYRFGGRPYEVEVLLEQLGYAKKVRVKRSNPALPNEVIKHNLEDVIVRMLKDEDEEVSTQGLFLLKNFINRLIPVGIEGKRYVHPDKPRFSTRELELKEELSAKLKELNPNYKYEYLYGRLLGKNSGAQASGNISWEKRQGKAPFIFSSKNLTDYTMAQLLCKQEHDGTNWFKASSWFEGGMPHVFPHPHIGDEQNYCKNYFLPNTDQDDKGKHFLSLNTSFFITERGLHQGLLQLYLNLPEGPGVFNTEQETRQWWINEVEPEAYGAIEKLKEKYVAMVKEKLLPKVGNLYRARDILGLNAGSFLSKVKGFFGTSYESLEYTAGEDLAEGLAAELKEYQAVIGKLGGFSGSQFKAKENMSRCLVDLLGSINRKNYKALKKQCESQLNELKNQVLFSDGSTQQDLTVLTRKEEKKLSGKEMAKLVGLTTFIMIDKVFAEVDSYKKMATGELSFSLEKEEKENCFEHNLNNFNLNEKLTEKDNESTSPCFNATSN